ncbi:MAG: AAA family ATPase [Bacillus sp. (in: firmicutes)]
MRIKEIHIYGYGKMKDCSFTDLQDFQVFFGENEAGKSTIMSFIHSILFGFPAKTQNENRYEPKDHSAYGGKLVLETEKDGVVTVQRIKGKASGDVTVTYKDGRTGTDAELHALLQGMDKSAYQSIFSFDLNGLSELQKLSENEVSRFMLSAGLLGSDDLLKAEQHLQKEMEANFKPAGKLPKINQLLMDTQTSYESLNQAGSEQDLYEQHKEDFRRFSEEKLQIEERLIKLRDEIKLSRNYLTAEPLLLEEARLRQKLYEMEGIVVPAEAEEQFQQLKNALLPIEASIQSAKIRREQTENKREAIPINEQLRANQEAVQSAVDKSARTESMIYERQNLQQQKQQNDDRIQRLKDEMNLHMDDEDILRLDHSAMKKESVLKLDHTEKKLQHDKEVLDKKQEEAQATLEAIKKRMRDLKSSLLSENDKAALEKQVDRYENASSANMQLELINQSIHSLEKQIKKGKEKEAAGKKHGRQLFLIIFAALLIGAGVSFMMQQWLLAVVMLIATIIVFLFRGSFVPPSIIADLQEQLQELQQQRNEMINHTGPVSKDEIKHAMTLLDRDYETSRLLQNEAVKKAEHEALFYRTIDEFEKWEQDMARLQLEKEQVLHDWRLNGQHISTSMLPLLYEAIAKLKNYIYENKHLIEKIEALNNQISSAEEMLIDYCKQYAHITTESYVEAALLLKNQLEETNKGALQREEWNESIRNLDEELRELQLQKAHFHEQLQELFTSAACENEAEFLMKVQLAKEKAGYKEKLEIMQLQLAPYEEERRYWEQSEAAINSYSVSELEEEKTVCEQRLSELDEQLADRRLRIQQLEEAGSFDERSFQYYAKKSELDEQAKEWMALSLAKNMLNKVVHSYKSEKFPEILRNAEKFVEAITDGEYISLYWKDEDEGLMLQRKDGVVFEAKEVSRGTQEGIYVALRLSLAGHVYANHAMPIIIDDGFVNFDRGRVENVMNILKSLQNKQQIIFFTCHDYLLPYFNKAQIVQLSGTKLTL